MGIVPKGRSCLTISGGRRKSSFAAGKRFLAISWADFDLEAIGARVLTGAFFSLAAGFAGVWTDCVGAEVDAGCSVAAVATTALSAPKTPINTRLAQYVAFITPTALSVQVRMLALYAQANKLIIVNMLPRLLPSHRTGLQFPGRADWQACQASSGPVRLRGSRAYRSLTGCNG